MGLLAGRSSHFVLSRLGRGSTLPGKLALQFDKDILQNLAKNYEIVVVTGTNGKTLTTALTVGILKEVYGQVLTNPSGANMITGIATTFLTAKSSKTGKNIAVLEIDEASLSRICDYIKPSLFVITNIFRDQMDRYGEILHNLQDDFWMLFVKCLLPLFSLMETVHFSTSQLFQILYSILVLTWRKAQPSCSL